MFPQVSGSKGSKELPVNLNVSQINQYILEANQVYFFHDILLIFYNVVQPAI